MRSNTWCLDLPAATMKSVTSGSLATTVLEHLKVSSPLVIVLSFVAPFIFELRRAQIQPSDMVIQAELRATVGDGPRRLIELYLALPDRIRSGLTLRQFADAVERLLWMRYVISEPDGLRIQECSARPRFHLMLREPRLLPEIMSINEPTVDLADLAPSDANTVQEPPAPSDGRGYQPRVFVTYAHDSPGHKKRVLDFCRLLAESGIDVRVDQWALDKRRDWQLWATKEVLKADFVIVIASPACKRVGDGDVAWFEHRGMQSEMRTLRELYHSDPVTWTRKILPAVLPGSNPADIPLFLQPNTADHFLVTSIDKFGAEELLRLILGNLADQKEMSICIQEESHHASHQDPEATCRTS